jgi:glycosyltransferase involved in cell wall biosynthesis
MKTDISVIVPVFNSDKFLTQCIDSLLHQTDINIEIILVDDGSTDNSSLICDNIAKTDSRIKVIHKANEGVSTARNTGILSAQGEYIGFVDSDDWCCFHMFGTLYRQAVSDNSDIVFCNYYSYVNERYKENTELTQLKDSKNIKDKLLKGLLSVKKNQVSGCCFRLIMKRSFVIQNHLLFDNRFKIYEDLLFVLQSIDKTEKISIIQDFLYYRRIHKDSVTNNYISILYKNILEIKEGILNLSMIKENESSYLELLETWSMNGIIFTLSNLCNRGTPYSLIERLYYMKAIKFDKKQVYSIKYFKTPTYIQLILLKLKLTFVLVFLHSVKERTLFYN